MTKLVFVDMDGTFLSPDKTISRKNLAILDEAAARDVQFVPCTGRNVTGVPRELAEHPCVRYAICCNGALIYDVRTNEVLREVAIERELVRSLYEDVRALDITFDLFADGTVYAAADRWHVLDKMAIDPASLKQVKSVRTRCDEPVDKLIERVGSICRINVFYLDGAGAQGVWDAVDARPELIRSSSLPCNVEITRAEAHKGAGLRWLCERLGVDVSDTVAFGDSDNDLTMLREAGDGVAMGNANEACRAAADHTCPSCSDSGVARYLCALWA